MPADEQEDPRRFGYSRDKRVDCVQVIVALVVTPEGLPLAYAMFPGNTADKTTLRQMLLQTHPKSLRPGRTHLGDGPGHSHRDGLIKMRSMGASYLVGTPRAG